MHTLWALLTASLDSGVGAIAVGTLSMSRDERFKLAAAFGICDALASLVGSSVIPVVFDPPVFVLYLICAALMGFALRGSRASRYGLALALSLDNLMICRSPGAALASGLFSAILALAGLYAGRQCARYFRTPLRIRITPLSTGV
jgi:putative Mn2+ efflux pump MntP